MKIIKNLVLCAVISLSGCVTNPFLYNPENRKISNLSKVTAEELENSKYTVVIEEIYDERNVEITKRGALSNFYSEFLLPPGRYKLSTRCESYQYGGRGVAYPEAILVIEVGKNYNITCEYAREEKTFFGLLKDQYIQIKISETPK